MGAPAFSPSPPLSLSSSPPSTSTVVWLHPEAPAKPAEGAPCNGCGLCCLAEPCPLGVVVSRRRKGACVALRWSDAEQRYLCGMVADPGGVTGFTHPWAVRALSALARRWIASGVGCDARLQTQPLPPPQPPASEV
jgi:hypothetical protein